MASCVEDSLEGNRFYIALQTKFKKEFEQAQEECSLICIPKSESLQGYIINKKFVELHILRSSPYFQNQYISHCKNKSKIISLEENKIITLEGFETSNVIDVVSEELGYNKALKPYKILILEQPLDSIMAPISPSDSIDLLKLHSSSSECRQLLEQCPEYQSALLLLDDYITQLKNNHVFLAPYIEEDIAKMKNICENIIELLLNEKVENGSQLVPALGISVESILFRDLHCKIFPIICKKFASEDALIFAKISKNRKYISHETLSVSQDFRCPLATSVSKLSKLEDYITPLEKLACFKTTLDLINDDITDFAKSNPTYCHSSLPSLTVDDLIPLLIIIISKCQLQHLFSNIYYIEQCMWSVSNKDHFGFSLITFKAAQEFIKDTDFKALSEEKQNCLATSENAELSTVSIKSHDAVKNNQDNSLGDFLSSLRKDVFGYGFGKQT